MKEAEKSFTKIKEAFACSLMGPKILNAAIIRVWKKAFVCRRTLFWKPPVRYSLHMPCNGYIFRVQQKKKKVLSLSVDYNPRTKNPQTGPDSAG